MFHLSKHLQSKVQEACGLAATERRVVVLFRAGDYVIYGNEGVCEVAGVSHQNFGGESEEYYELVPKYRENTSVLIPVKNEKLTKKMLPLLSREEVEKLVASIPDIGPQWIDNDNQRKERYKQMLSSGDRRDLVCILKTLYIHKIECVDRGRKLHAADEKFFAEASEKLNCEVATVFGITPEDAERYIVDSVKKLTGN